MFLSSRKVASRWTVRLLIRFPETVEPSTSALSVVVTSSSEDSSPSIFVMPNSRRSPDTARPNCSTIPLHSSARSI